MRKRTKIERQVRQQLGLDTVGAASVREVETLTREVLRRLKPGQTQTYEFPTTAKCLSARSTIYQMQRVEERKYTQATDFATKRVTVTRIL